MKKITSVLFFVLFSTQLKAQYHTRIPVSAFTFLTLNAPDARHGGMGDVGVATSSDETDYYWNPSKTAFSTRRFGFFVAPYSRLTLNSMIVKIVGETHFSNFGGFYKLNDREAISANFNYTNQSLVLNKDNSFGFIFKGTSLLDLTSIPQWIVSVNYYRKLSPNLSLGLGIKYINASYQDTSIYRTTTGSRVYNDVVQTFGLDISLYHKDQNFTRPITVDYGICISNIGGKVNYDGSIQDQFMPTNLRIGVAPSFKILSKHKITLAVDANKLLVPTPPERDANGNVMRGRDNRNLSALEGMIGSLWDAPDGFREEWNEINWNFGVEYWFNNVVALRVGKTIESKYPWGRDYITFGVGTKIKKVVGIDFAYMVNQNQSSIIGDILRANINVSFGKLKTQHEQK